MVTIKDTCRICGQSNLYDFFDLGSMPPANTLISQHTFNMKEPEFPLAVTVCLPCGFMQLKHVVNPNILFRYYQYMSSASSPYVDHFRKLTGLLIKECSLVKGSLVIDIGSNDGSLLKAFIKCDMKAIGIDPAQNLARQANMDGIETICNYFTPQVAKSIVIKDGPAKLVTATNVFAHVDNLKNLIEAIDIVLDSDGTFVAQFSYLGDIILSNAFDTIYHEHLSYFSIESLTRLFAKSPLELISAEKIPIHGGSLRILVKKRGGRKNLATKLSSQLTEEKALRLHEKETYRQFAIRAQAVKKKLINLLVSLAKDKKFVVGLGAPAKGITLINFAKLTDNYIRFIVDSTPAKHSHFTPRSRIPIVPERVLRESPPDYAVIFAWNFAEEIMRKTNFIKKNGGKYIIPIPNVKII